MHHITHIKNLENILKAGGLIARNFLEREFTDTANHDIISNRKCINGEDLNNFVPFHNDHLQKEYGISYNFDVCETYGKENMIYLIFNPSEVTSSPFGKYLFYVYHPASTYAELCQNLGVLTIKLNEELKCLPKLSSCNRLNLRSKKVQKYLMSEILIHEYVSLRHLKFIYVYNEEIKDKVENYLKKYNFNGIKVEVEKTFY